MTPSRGVEAVVVKGKRMPVHYAGVDFQAFPAGALSQQAEHDGRLVDSDHLGTDPSCRNTERAAAGCNVEKAPAGAEPCPDQTLIAKPDRCFGIRPIVTRGNSVPSLACVRQRLRNRGFGLDKRSAQHLYKCGRLFDRRIIGCAVDNVERPPKTDARGFRYRQWGGKIVPPPDQEGRDSDACQFF